MFFRSYLPYYVARRVAADLDRRGVPPSPVLLALNAVTVMALVGLGLCAGFALVAVAALNALRLI